MKLTILITSFAALSLTSCQTTGPLTSIYDKDGNEVAKVSEKTLASIKRSDSIPIVRLVKEDWAALGDKMLDAGMVVGKGVVSSYVDRYVSGKVNPSK